MSIGILEVSIFGVVLVVTPMEIMCLWLSLFLFTYCDLEIKVIHIVHYIPTMIFSNECVMRGGNVGSWNIND